MSTDKTEGRFEYRHTKGGCDITDHKTGEVYSFIVGAYDLYDVLKSMDREIKDLQERLKPAEILAEMFENLNHPKAEQEMHFPAINCEAEEKLHV